MFEIPLKLPEPIYYQLRAAAEKKNQSITDLLLEVISQRFPPAAPAQMIQVRIERTECLENQPEGSDYKFVTEWAL